MQCNNSRSCGLEKGKNENKNNGGIKLARHDQHAFNEMRKINKEERELTIKHHFIG